MHFVTTADTHVYIVHILYILYTYIIRIVQSIILHPSLVGLMIPKILFYCTFVSHTLTPTLQDSNGAFGLLPPPSPQTPSLTPQTIYVATMCMIVAEYLYIHVH